MKWYLSVMEDIISVLDGRPEIIEAVKGAETELKHYLKDRLAGLLKNQNFIERGIARSFAFGFRLRPPSRPQVNPKSAAALS